MQMEEYIWKRNRKFLNPINPILVGCLYFIWGERGRNLDPCQIDNFVSSLSSPPRIARISPAGLIWLNVD